MGAVARVFLRDAKRLAKTPAAWSVVLFLVVLPSLYTWFNVAAFWNPYDNTGNLRVCVVNEDAGVDNDMLGHLDVGSQLVDQLQDNDQLDWAFVTRDEAIDDVGSGRAYAAFVIPETFSSDIATLTTDAFEQPVLEYYVNEKAGPVSPKITDTGANALDTTINDTFFATVSSTIAEMLEERLGASRLQIAAAKAQAVTDIDKAIADVREARRTVAGFDAAVQAAREDALSINGSLESAKTRIDQGADALERAESLIGKADAGLVAVSSEAGRALDESSAQVAKAAAQTSLAIGQTAAAIESAKAATGLHAIGEGWATPDYSGVIALLEQLKDRADEAQKERIDDAIETLREAPKPGERWRQLERELEEAAASAGSADDPVASLLSSILSAGDEYRTIVNDQAVPAISAGLASLASASGDLSAAIASQRIAVDQARSVVDELDSTLSLTQGALSRTDRALDDVEFDLTQVRTDLQSLSAADALSGIVGENGIDPEKVADFMMSPTRVQREELYPLNAYGSAMAPLFINLTLWIGVFMLMVIFRLEVDDEDLEEPTIAQRSFGRGLLLAIIAALQAIVCCAGCLVMGVQTANDALFVVTAVIASLTYLSIQYTLSSSLQHVGKAICIILVFVQIPGATGLYPIEMTPAFFQHAYPLFPFTYGINAIRETIGGFYDGTWGSCIGVLAAFMAGFLIVGTIARPYLTNINRLFAREIEASDIIIGESVQLPARRYRMSEVISALTNHDDYRAGIEERVSRFMKLYPQLKQGALVVGIAFPILTTSILMTLGVDKVVVLTTWLAWFGLVVAYLITVEYLHDYLSHLASLEGMTEAEVRTLYENRERLTRVQPLEGSANFLKPPSQSALRAAAPPKPKNPGKGGGDA